MTEPHPSLRESAAAPVPLRERLRPLAAHTFASFAHRNYRLWFMGQAASLVGTWMQSTAQGFLVFELTHSPAYLGYVGFAAGLPTWLFILFGGVISDRVSRRNLMVVTQSAMMVLAFILAALTFLKIVQAWEVVALAFGVGVANAFEAAARQALVVDLVEREDLANAIALNSTMFNLAVALGPAAAGIIYALFGPAWCFFINGLSFLAVIAALLMMEMKPRAQALRAGSALHHLREGLEYTLSHSTIRVLIVVAIAISLLGIGPVTLFPDWAVNVLNGDSATNGFLQSARGIGSLLAALMIAALGRRQFKGKLLNVGLLLFPVFLLVWSLTNWLPLSLLFIVGVGWGTMLALNVTNALIQSIVPDRLRGRVMSVYALGFFGMMPIGALVAGAAAQQFGAPLTVAVSAVLALAFAVSLWALMPRLRTLE